MLQLRITENGEIEMLQHDEWKQYYVSGEKVVHFELTKTSSIVVLTNGDARNVYLLNSSGEILWKIEQAPLRPFDKIDDPFSGIYYSSDTDTLKAATIDGQIYEVDLRTGKLIKYLGWERF